MTNTPSRQVLLNAIRKALKNGWVGGSFDSKEHPNDLIFNHDFAKALWPDKGTKLFRSGDDPEYVPDWQYHLQQMVIADDPIKYLEANI